MVRLLVVLDHHLRRRGQEGCVEVRCKTELNVYRQQLSSGYYSALSESSAGRGDRMKVGAVIASEERCFEVLGIIVHSASGD